MIQALKTAEHCGAFDRARARLAVGDEVRVPVGPFAHLIAKIRSARPRRRAELVGEFAFRISAPVDKLVKVIA